MTSGGRFACFLIQRIINYNAPGFSAISFMFLVVFSFFEKNYLMLSCATSVRLSVRLSSVEIFSFRGNSLSSKPIDLKIGLNVREGVVHVRKA